MNPGASARGRPGGGRPVSANLSSGGTRMPSGSYPLAPGAPVGFGELAARLEQYEKATIASCLHRVFRPGDVSGITQEWCARALPQDSQELSAFMVPGPLNLTCNT